MSKTTGNGTTDDADGTLQIILRRDGVSSGGAHPPPSIHGRWGCTIVRISAVSGAYDSLVVASVVRDSPADHAGLARGDAVVGMFGGPLGPTLQLFRILMIADCVEISVRRTPSGAGAEAEEDFLTITVPAPSPARAPPAPASPLSVVPAPPVLRPVVRAVSIAERLEVTPDGAEDTPASSGPSPPAAPPHPLPRQVSVLGTAAPLPPMSPALAARSGSAAVSPMGVSPMDDLCAAVTMDDLYFAPAVPVPVPVPAPVDTAAMDVLCAAVTVAAASSGPALAPVPETDGQNELDWAPSPESVPLDTEKEDYDINIAKLVSMEAERRPKWVPMLYFGVHTCESNNARPFQKVMLSVLHHIFCLRSKYESKQDGFLLDTDWSSYTTEEQHAISHIVVACTEPDSGGVFNFTAAALTKHTIMLLIEILDRNKFPKSFNLWRRKHNRYTEQHDSALLQIEFPTGEDAMKRAADLLQNTDCEGVVDAWNEFDIRKVNFDVIPGFSDFLLWAQKTPELNSDRNTLPEPVLSALTPAPVEATTLITPTEADGQINGPADRTAPRDGAPAGNMTEAAQKNEAAAKGTTAYGAGQAPTGVTGPLPVLVKSERMDENALSSAAASDVLAATAETASPAVAACSEEAETASVASASTIMTTTTTTTMTKATAPQESKKRKAPTSISASGASLSEVLKKAKNDPDAPKRAKSPYLFFFASRRLEIMKVIPNISSCNLSRQIVKEFEVLPSAQKNKWKEKAVKDRLRYKNEMKTYVPPPDNIHIPRRPKTAYMWFCFHEKHKLKKYYPHLTYPQLSNRVVLEYQKLCVMEKKKYENMAEIDSKRYEKDMATYRTKSGRAGDEAAAAKSAPAVPVQNPKSTSSAGGEAMPGAPPAPQNASVSVTEDWRNMLELLRTLIRNNSPRPGSAALKSIVGGALRQTNLARFPNREALKDFLAHAIKTGAVIESGQGCNKLLSLPEDNRTGTALYSASILVSPISPIPLETLSPKAREMYSVLPFVLFALSIHCPKEQEEKFPGGAYVHKSAKWVLLMFRTLHAAQQAFVCKPWLRQSGILVDARNVECAPPPPPPLPQMKGVQNQFFHSDNMGGNGSNYDGWRPGAMYREGVPNPDFTISSRGDYVDRGGRENYPLPIYSDGGSYGNGIGNWNGNGNANTNVNANMNGNENGGFYGDYIAYSDHGRFAAHPQDYPRDYPSDYQRDPRDYRGQEGRY
mmetsp:Transcript_12804/g.25575  ORF Transcript_12804/g.25575 Transcript_12804/m.25575 type:complete len:1217 (+) Transcript_12804:85-3735(+)